MTTNATTLERPPGNDTEQASQGDIQTPVKTFGEAVSSLYLHAIAKANDYEEWAKQPYWTVDEATALSLKKNPKFVQFDVIKSYERYDSFSKDFLDTRALITRAIEIGSISEAIDPCEFIEWAEHRIQLHDDLISAVQNSQKLFKKPQSESSITKERNTLQLILYAIAKEQFKFSKDTKNPATSRILSLYQRLGIAGGSSGTIRTHILKGEEIWLDKKSQIPN